MKVHIGVDSQSGLIHSASVSAGNVHDSQELPNLLHGSSNAGRPKPSRGRDCIFIPMD